MNEHQPIVETYSGEWVKTREFYGEYNALVIITDHPHRHSFWTPKYTIIK